MALYVVTFCVCVCDLFSVVSSCVVVFHCLLCVGLFVLRVCLYGMLFNRMCCL